MRSKSPTWSPMTGREVEQQVASLAREGKSSAQIGALMRDQFGVPLVKLATGKRVQKILADQNAAPRVPEEITNLLKRVVNLQDHLARAGKDLANRRALSLLEAKIRRLAKYYKREGKLPTDWKYSTETAKLLLQ
jgi:small subunit ribosomal protein S15